MHLFYNSKNNNYHKIPFRLTDPLSTSSVILVQDKESIINIDQTDSFGDQSIHFEQSHHTSHNIAQM